MSSSGVGSRQKNCSACVKSKRRCDKRKPACGRCVRQRYPCIYGGRGLSELTFGDPADAPFGMDYLIDPTPNPDAFAPAPDALPTMLGSDLGLAPDVTFQLDNDFGPLLSSMPGSGNGGSSSFLGDSWSSHFIDISGVVPHEKSLVRKDYSKMTPMCVSPLNFPQGKIHASKPASTGGLCTLAASRPFVKSFLHHRRLQEIPLHLRPDQLHALHPSLPLQG